VCITQVGNCPQQQQYHNYYNHHKALQLTNSFYHAGQGSLTGKALKDSWNQMFSAVPRGRKSKLVLLTDGPSNDDVKMPSKWIRDNGVEVFVIGLGKGYNEGQIQDMASVPSDRHIMYKDYDGLKNSIQEVRNKVCGFNADEGLYSTEKYRTQNCNCHLHSSWEIEAQTSGLNSTNIYYLFIQ
jgi:hypothetical protein